MAELPLLGKVAIVTGAGSPIGIGRAIAAAFVRAGARVAMIDINREWLEESARGVGETGGDGSVLPIIADVADYHDAEAAVARAIGELGGLHILVNNAGANPRSVGLAPEGASTSPNAWEITHEAWARVVAVNMSGPFYMTKAALGHMLGQGWGRIIGVTTSLDTMYRKGESPYGPSKAGHEALAATLARELEGTGVTVNLVAPGGRTNTNLLGPGITDDRSLMIQSEVMQAPAVWLASEESSGVNGMRFIARYWDESLPLKERMEKAGAPAAWPQSGRGESGATT